MLWTKQSDIDYVLDTPKGQISLRHFRSWADRGHWWLNTALIDGQLQPFEDLEKAKAEADKILAEAGVSQEM